MVEFATQGIGAVGLINHLSDRCLLYLDQHYGELCTPVRHHLALLELFELEIKVPRLVVEAN